MSKGALGGMRELRLRPRDPEYVSMGQRQVFPADLVEELCLDLSRSLDCHVPTGEGEAAVVSFVAALVRRGWKVYRPELDPHSSSKR